MSFTKFATHHGINFIKTNENFDKHKEHMFDLNHWCPVTNSILDQCNGSVSDHQNRVLLSFIPCEYVENEEYVLTWLKECELMGFPIEYHGIKTSEDIDVKNSFFRKDRFSETCDNLNIAETLNKYYGSKKEYNKFYTFIIKENNGKIRLASFSLLRCLYPKIYEGLIEEYLQLRKTYPNVEPFQLYLFALHTYPNASLYIASDNGAYNLISTLKKVGIVNRYANLVSILEIDMTGQEYRKRISLTGVINCLNTYRVKNDKPTVRFNNPTNDALKEEKLGYFNEFKDAISKKDFLEFKRVIIQNEIDSLK